MMMLLKKNSAMTSWKFFLQCLVFASALPLILGWGKEGHEIVGNLAYSLLSNETKAAIHEILLVAPSFPKNDYAARNSKNHNEDPNSSPLGDIADWADTVRHSSEYHWSGPLHYIDIHDNNVEGGCPVFHQTTEQQEKCHFDYERDCADDFCVAGAIVNYTSYLSEWKHQQQQQEKQSLSEVVSHRLRGSASLLMPWTALHQQHQHQQQQQPLPTKLVQDSLKFLTHFVGDIHQPLHSARTTDRGGNSIDVVFENNDGTSSLSFIRHEGQELHAVWDSGIIERALYRDYNGSRAALEDELLDYIIEAKDTGDLNKWLQCPDTTQRHCTTLWAEESWQNALEWAYKNSDDNGESEVVSGSHLTEMYYETRLPKIKHFLAVAGVRLAASLEIALGKGSSPNTDALSSALRTARG